MLQVLAAAGALRLDRVLVGRLRSNYGQEQIKTPGFALHLYLSCAESAEKRYNPVLFGYHDDLTEALANANLA